MLAGYRYRSPLSTFTLLLTDRFSELDSFPKPDHFHPLPLTNRFLELEGKRDRSATLPHPKPPGTPATQQMNSKYKCNIQVRSQ
ncbi:MAG: hypothetical protein HC769_34540, partial [Cyanobacteria bacterium CRU_2_1]|nr:hypothetical protein [Cyanobacteria bacterium CRU_2_1]